MHEVGTWIINRNEKLLWFDGIELKWRITPLMRDMLFAWLGSFKELRRVPFIFWGVEVVDWVVI